MKAGELGAVLRGGDFRRLYAVRLTSQLTDGLFQVALAGYVFFSPERQTSAGRTAAAFAALLLPYSVIGPFVGVLIDRWSRRQILVWAPVGRAALVAAAAGLLFLGYDGAPFLISALLVLGVNRFFLSALSAALPHVVREDLLVTANALSVTSGTAIAFAGGGLGAGLRFAVGGGRAATVSILLAAAGCYLAAALVATTLRRDQLGPAPTGAAPQARRALGGVLRGLLDGARTVRGNATVLRVLAAIAGHRFLYGITLIMTLLLYRNHFTTDPDAGFQGAAVALGVSGAGFLVGAVITPPVVHLIGRDTWITVLLAAAAPVVAILGLPFAEFPWLAMAFLLGVVSQGIKLCVDTTLQSSLADVYRGRVFAVYDMLFNTTFVGAAAVAAIAVPSGGVSTPVLLAVIAAYVLGAALYRTAVIHSPQGAGA